MVSCEALNLSKPFLKLLDKVDAATVNDGTFRSDVCDNVGKLTDVVPNKMDLDTQALHLLRQKVTTDDLDLKVVAPILNMGTIMLPHHYKLDALSTALFLTFLGTLGGFIGGGIASKAIQRMIAGSAIVKNLVLFLLIFFTSSFTAESGVSPITMLIQAVILYVLFIGIMKSTVAPLIVAASLLLVGLLIKKQIAHVVSVGAPPDHTKSLKHLKQLRVAQDVVGYAAVGTIVIGVGLYMMKQYNDHPGSFSLMTFFLGADDA